LSDDLRIFFNFEQYLNPKTMKLEIYGVNNLNFVEFNITGNIEAFQRCDKDSFFMDTELFNLFSECFENSNNLYDYFGPTRFNARNIIVLLNELTANFKKIEQIDGYEAFIDFTGNKFLGTSFVLELEKTDKNWGLNWEQYKKRLISVNQQLIDIINRCIESERILWLIGY
jgi:hypothetical protein